MRITTTTKINETLTNNLLHIQKAEVYYKSSDKAERIDADKVRENFSFLCESGIFADALGWHFERNIETKGYTAECGRMNPDSEIIITVYLGVCENVNGEDVERTLNVTEEE